MAQLSRCFKNQNFVKLLRKRQQLELLNPKHNLHSSLKAIFVCVLLFTRDSDMSECKLQSTYFSCGTRVTVIENTAVVTSDVIQEQQ